MIQLRVGWGGGWIVSVLKQFLRAVTITVGFCFILFLICFVFGMLDDKVGSRDEDVM